MILLFEGKLLIFAVSRINSFQCQVKQSIRGRGMTRFQICCVTVLFFRSLFVVWLFFPENQQDIE